MRSLRYFRASAGLVPAAALLFSAIVLAPRAHAQAPAPADPVRVVPGEIIVSFTTADDQFELDEVIDAWALPGIERGVAVESSRLILQWTKPGDDRYTNVATLKLPKQVDADAILTHVAGLDGVEWTSPNYSYVGDPREFIPNDPQYGSQYHHPLMQNDLAWDITLGDPSIIVAVTDDGVDLDHVDLATNIWINPGEIAGNGIDDEGNGYIDDVNGWDVVHDNNDPNPEGGNDHGTHVSGIAAARTNNAVGVAGTAGEATIMPIQWYDGNGGTWTSAVIAESFAYAVDNGARIVTTSYNMNGWVDDPTVHAGFQYMYDHGGLHFNSAGNGNDLNPPRQIFHQTLLVASTNSGDVRSGFSNYGTGIDLAAPGEDVYSTILNNNYGTKSGTSMAAPNAAGVAALIWSANPTWTRDQVAAQLLATCDNIDAQNPSFVGWLGAGRANSFRGVTETLPAPKVAQSIGLPDDGACGTIDENVFTIQFDQVMATETVNDPNAFSMTFAGPDGAFGTGDESELPLSWTPYLVGTNLIEITVEGPDLVHGLYRFRADASVLANPFGTPLDGNGDGTGGDSFETTFSFISACAADVTGDNFVNVDDLLLVLGAWNTPGPGDVTCDGTVNVDDLLEVLAGWGSCITGACCLDNGTCIDVTEATCNLQGGTYIGDETDCASAGCGAAPNDLCQNAEPVEDGDHPFFTIDAGTDGPAHGSCQFDGQTYHDIWFTYTAPADGSLLVSLCDQADYDTDLVIYDGCDCGDLILLDCEDDTSGCSGWTSQLTVPVVQDDCYLIRVGGYVQGSQGTGTMTVDGPDAP